MFKKLMLKCKENILRFDSYLINNKKAKRVILGIFCVFVLVFAYFLLNYSELVAVYKLEKEVSNKVKDMKIALGGEAVGIKLLATGVLVVELDRDDTSLQIGDVILSANNVKVSSYSNLQDIVQSSNGNDITLKVSRNKEEFETKITPLKDSISGRYLLGLWVKDSSAGVGTITFYDLNNKSFVALGHGVTETKENYVLPIDVGGITSTTIYSIKKGIPKVPGELKGSITNDLLGEINGNTDKGIFGKILNNKMLENKEEIEILPKSKIKEGKASIICTLDDNQKKEYEVNIEKVMLTSSGNKNMIIKITDNKLIEKTGGIIQGMSGSPIIQDGKLVGSVTHVFLNDCTMGYGVFIENMIEDMDKNLN